MPDTTRRYLDMFWELIDEMLNAMLLALIGMEVLFLVHSIGEVAVAAAVAIAVTLAARLVTVGVPVGLLQRFFNLPRGSWKVLTWGGLRGGISVALALSLPAGPERDTVAAVTYWCSRYWCRAFPSAASRAAQLRLAEGRESAAHPAPARRDI